ncbi:MAG: TIGR01777 family oxidoreductase [Cellvibrionaceae bacterium]
MHILITGGTGFIGVPLVQALLARGDQVTLLSRNFKKTKRLFDGKVSLIGSIGDAGIEANAVINLAGEPIIDKRWTDKRKRTLKESRIDFTLDVVEWIAQCEKKPEVFINGSAIGYYGNYPEGDRLDETAKPRPCFSSDLCVAWESAAKQAMNLDLRVCLVRTGVVLAAHGGALKRMLMPFKVGLGGPIANGSQWFSWIHLDDMVNLLLHLLDNQSISGPVNATAPNPVTNKVFSQKLARVLHRPALLPMPEKAVKILFGESSELLLEGQKVYPKKLLDNQFRFQYPELQQALTAVIHE